MTPVIVLTGLPYFFKIYIYNILQSTPKPPFGKYLVGRPRERWDIVKRKKIGCVSGLYEP
jgi:hypothetical protein